MKFYQFDIQNNKIDEYNGEVSGISHEYHQYIKSFGVEEVYYKTKNGIVTDIICEAFSEKTAIEAVNSFLSSL